MWLAALHDLRQPLQSALLLMTAAQDEAEDRRRRRTLGLAELSLLGLQGMLDDLALASRLVSGHHSVSSNGGCRLQEALAAAVAEFAEQPRLAQVRVRATAATSAVDSRTVRIVALALLAVPIKLDVTGPIVLVAEVVAAGLRVTIEHPPADVLASDIMAAMFVELPALPAGASSRLFAPGLGLAQRISRALGGDLACHFSDEHHSISVLLPHS